MKQKSTPIPTPSEDFESFIKGVFLIMLLSTIKLGLMSLKNDKFLKALIIVSAAMLVWYVGRTPIEFNNISVWTPTFVLVDIGAAATSVCSIVFIVLYLLVKRKVVRLGFSGVIEWLRKDC